MSYAQFPAPKFKDTMEAADLEFHRRLLVAFPNKEEQEGEKQAKIWQAAMLDFGVHMAQWYKDKPRSREIQKLFWAQPANIQHHWFKKQLAKKPGIVKRFFQAWREYENFVAKFRGKARPQIQQMSSVRG